jgi:hypothetical protein
MQFVMSLYWPGFRWVRPEGALRCLSGVTLDTLLAPKSRLSPS